MKAVPVTLGGVDLVWMKGDDGSGALAYPHHVDEDGHVKAEHVCSDSYAHVFGDRIQRFGEVIGTPADLKARDG